MSSPLAATRDDERHRVLAGYLIDELSWREIGRAYELSDRELAVARLVTLDLSRDQIARLLKKTDGTSLSGDTVRVYIDRLFRKLCVSSRVQLVTMLIAESLRMRGHRFGDLDEPVS
ncbi:MAG: helix-turn-helix transcriptional regulator [Planctomycetota bacterium]